MGETAWGFAPNPTREPGSLDPNLSYLVLRTR